MNIELFDLLLLLLLAMVCFYFWQIRATAEAAKTYLNAYCKQHNLQLISIARRKSKLIRLNGKLAWQSEFAFEFSGNLEDAYSGNLTLQGKKIISQSMPAYRVK